MFPMGYYSARKVTNNHTFAKCCSITFVSAKATELDFVMKFLVRLVGEQMSSSQS